MNILDELEWRGLVADCTAAADLRLRIEAGPITLYAGFDPSADSLHVGNLVPLLALRRFQLHGHHPIAVAGGATGSIGDPSGKAAERQLLSKEVLESNIAALKGQLRRLLDFERQPNPVRLVDNAQWTRPVGVLDFLREIGKHFSVNQMIAKESVRARMEDRESGISFAEMSYMVLQAFDFYHLRQQCGCELQIGGADQWGNITAGIDLIRKKLGLAAYGLTLPLITNADGSKFGKTEAGAVWLDAGRTSVYRFYQFWVRVDDRDVVPYLKYFTFLAKEDIDNLAQEVASRPEGRAAQKALGKAMTELVHGATAASEAARASEILFGGGLEGVSERTFEEIAAEIPSHQLERPKLDGAGMPLVEMLVLAGLCPSKGQARKDIEGGGVYLNNARQSSPRRTITGADLLFGRYLLLRKGKRNYAAIRAV